MHAVGETPQDAAPVFEELDANIHQAHSSLAVLTELLAACPQAHRVGAQALRLLLLPVVDQMAQAAAASRLLLPPQLRRPP